MNSQPELIDEPKIVFHSWESWEKRPTTFDPTYHVPRWFDMPGLYFLARFNPTDILPNAKEEAALHLNPQVVYIGASTRVAHRLEGKRHATVNKKYVDMFHDSKFKELFLSICYLEWRNLSFRGDKGQVKRAYLYHAERKLIWDFAKKYKPSSTAK